jgi:autotransporter translocation and assembly factor TamB
MTLREGRLRFDGVRLVVDRFSGEWGEGQFTLSGWAERGPGLSLKSLHLALKGSDLRFRVADLGRGTLDLDLQVEGEGSGPLVRGDLVLRRAIYSRDLLPAIPRRLRRWEDVVAGLPPPIRALRFDVNLRAPGDVSIQNNLARVELRGAFALRGTLSEPLLFGQAEVVQGSVVYRQREFRILAGRVDFVDPRRINPQFTVSAETLAQGVRVHLTLAGRLDRFTVHLASDPPLPRERIQALVAGGAATLAVGGGLPGKILEEAGRLAQLDVFQIEPMQEEKGGGARVLAGKRVTERLEVTYSRTISAAPTQRVTAEYQLTDAISLLGSQDERGAYGFDVRFSLSFP